MEHIKKGSIVARKSYQKDVLFKVTKIVKTNKCNVAILRGVIERVEADSPIDDLEIVDPKIVKDALKRFDSKIQHKLEKRLASIKNIKSEITGNLKNFEKIGNIVKTDNLENFGEIGNIVKTDNLENFGKIENVAKADNLENFGKIENVAKADNLENFRKIGNIKKVEKLSSFDFRKSSNIKKSSNNIKRSNIQNNSNISNKVITSTNSTNSNISNNSNISTNSNPSTNSNKLDRSNTFNIGILSKARNIQEKVITGKILHLDGDKKYSTKSYYYYKKLGLNAVVKNIPEYKQPKVVYSLLKIYQPDILIVTGHDGMIKRNVGYHDIYNYRNSRHFIETVKEARRYDTENNKTTVIFAGACQSYFEALISAGANFASSPARILIDFLDPIIVAEKVAVTENYKYITIDDIASEIRDGKKGVDGIGSKGKMKVLT